MPTVRRLSMLRPTYNKKLLHQYCTTITLSHLLQKVYCFVKTQTTTLRQVCFVTYLQNVAPRPTTRPWLPVQYGNCADNKSREEGSAGNSSAFGVHARVNNKVRNSRVG